MGKGIVRGEVHIRVGSAVRCHKTSCAIETCGIPDALYYCPSYMYIVSFPGSISPIDEAFVLALFPGFVAFRRSTERDKAWERGYICTVFQHSWISASG